MIGVQIGDCLELARSLESDSVDCIVTSPPYWGLRDYGTPDAWGLEPTLAEYLARLGSLFEELRRALKPSGTCWVNMGDSYVAGQGGRQSAVGECPTVHKVDRPTPKDRPELVNAPAGWAKRSMTTRTYPAKESGLRPKCLIGQPWRVAFMLQDQGWYLRQEIVWHKPNPMPESVRDRCTKSHEQIFLLTKSPKYYFDQDAIREPMAESSRVRLSQNLEAQEGPHRANAGGKTNGAMKAVSKRDTFARDSKECDVPGQSMRQHRADREAVDYGSCGANARTVWTIATVGFAEAHFAVFPPEIPRRCISAGCPPDGLVLDPFTGSGTTGMVAKQLGREFIGFEVNPEYAKMAEKRINSVTGSLFSEVS